MAPITGINVGDMQQVGNKDYCLQGQSPNYQKDFIDLHSRPMDIGFYRVGATA